MPPEAKKIDGKTYGDTFINRVKTASRERDRFRSEEARYTTVFHSVRKKFSLSNMTQTPKTAPG
jgi:hypothetical protein